MEKVTFEGKVYELLQDPYIDGKFNERPYYLAAAKAENGDIYMVKWDVKDNWEEISENMDEQEMCDWDNPVDVWKE